MKKLILSAVTLSLLLSACGPKEKPLTKEEKIRQYTQVTGTSVDPLYGKEIGFWYGALSGENDVNANGVGFIHKFEKGTTTVTANLNIAVAPEKQYHTAWLTDDKRSNFLKVGVMESIIGDVRHSATLSTKDDLAGQLSVLVTLESDAKASIPGETLEASGKLREVLKPQK